MHASLDHEIGPGPKAGLAAWQGCCICKDDFRREMNNDGHWHNHVGY